MSQPLAGVCVLDFSTLLPGPLAIDLPVQSALAQYTAPGTRRLVGTETCSAVLAMKWPIFEFPQGAVGGVTADPHGVPSAGPPAS